MSHILEPPAALSSQDLIALEERHGAHNYHPLEIVITRGEGVQVWDVEGRRYLDFLAAYSAVNQGHCHPRLVRALAEQAQRLTLCSRAFRNDQLGRLCQEISALTGYDRFLPMNSGAEACGSESSSSPKRAAPADSASSSPPKAFSARRRTPMSSGCRRRSSSRGRSSTGRWSASKRY